jgi:Na+-translocating ferredoxin:NAD+ oxidoreductase RnfC subunit
LDPVQRARANGVVGAGGAGFPTYVKLQSRVDTLIVNAAECEPLLHKDKELLRAYTEEIVHAARWVQQLVGATRCIVGIKGKYADVVAALNACCRAKDFVIHPLADFYPAGDEFTLVHETTGRAIPPGKLPLHVGALVANVESLLNLHRDRPVTRKFLTIGGAVQHPCTIEAPLGMSIEDALAAAGGVTAEPFAVIAGGVMMGTLVADLAQPLTRTTGGLLVFPEDHAMVVRYRRSWDGVAKIGRASCDQCVFCTELCPRYLLGHPIQPHRSMKSLLFAQWDKSLLPHALYCCECNLCSMYACPEDLDPKNVCVELKRRAREAQAVWSGAAREPHPLLEDRRIPLIKLFRKLGLCQFVNEGPLRACPEPAKVRLLLQQHVGKRAEPVIRRGTRVREGDVVADVPEAALGVPIHASISGRVVAVTPEYIDLARE